MKKTQIFALFLSAAMSFSSLPAMGVSAAAADPSLNDTAQISVVKEANGGSSSSVRTGWVQNNGKWFFYASNGMRQTGWAKINNKWYYFDNNGIMKTGWQKIGGKYYLLGSNGIMKTGWQKVSGKWYYLAADGVMKTGWNKIGGKWYYLSSGGAMLTGWQKINNNWYYLGSGGAMYTGPHCYKIGGKYYFFEKGGALANKEGWRVSNLGNNFYVYADGTVATNKSIGNYTAGADGQVVLKTNNKMDKKAQGYSSATQYLILANRSTHKLCVYQGSKGNWKRIKGEWSFTSGASSTKTPCGVFKLTSKNSGKYGWKNFTLCRAAYVYHTSGGFMLHTILYSFSGGNTNPKNVAVVDGRLGYNLSKSCIRMSADHQGWIFNNLSLIHI